MRVNGFADSFHKSISERMARNPLINDLFDDRKERRGAGVEEKVIGAVMEHDSPQSRRVHANMTSSTLAEDANECH